MEAIILSGGFGTRLRPITYSRAKSLIPILNKPMISYLIDSLPDEIDKVILAVNYKKDQIENFFKKYDSRRKIIINNESSPLGTGGATKFAERYITGSFLVLNSDIMCSLDLNKMIKFHNKNNAVTTISLWPVENVSEFGVADVKDNGEIIGFVEKPRPEEAPSDFINAGAYFLEPDILDYIETKRLVSMEKEIFPRIIKDKGRFFGYKFQGYWMDIGRISTYIDIHKFLIQRENIKNFKGKNCEIKGILNESCIGDSVHIGKNSLLESTIVYDKTHVSDNVKLSYCVIGENCIIGRNSNLKRTVVGDNEILKMKSMADNKTIWTQQIPEGYPNKQIGNPIEI